MKSGLLFLVMVCLGCSCRSNSEIPNEKIDETYNNKEIKLGIGKTISIRLAGNITTGYTWNIKQLDESKVAVLKNEYQQGAKPGLGRGGERLLVLKGVAAGKITLKMAYQRSWEKNKKPVKEFQLTINVD